MKRQPSPLLTLALLCCVCLCGLPAAATAGPPFLTDDPEPVPFLHYEMYVFSTVDRGAGTTFAQLPAFEFNVGAAPNLQLHVVVPSGYADPHGAYGIGDVELGVKYRLIEEGGRRPQVGVFPMIELPTGNGHAGRGNGTVRARFPVWLQKSIGPWVTYGGVGYEVNHAPGMKDSRFAGWLIQRKLTGPLTLGAETYHSEAQEQGGRPSTFVDAGGYFNVGDHLSLLFMAGHTVEGVQRTIGYVGLYYKWGRDRSDGGPAWSAPSHDLHAGMRTWS